MINTRWDDTQQSFIIKGLNIYFTSYMNQQDIKRWQFKLSMYMQLPEIFKYLGTYVSKVIKRNKVNILRNLWNMFFIQNYLQT